MNRNSSPRKRSLRNKGLMLATCLCLLSLGMAAFVGFSTASPNYAKTAKTSSALSVSPPTVSYNVGTASTAPVAEIEEPTSSASVSSSAAPETVDAVTPTASFFVLPLTGEVIKGYKGDELQYSMTYGDYRLHTGIDIVGKLGDDIKSAGDGTVTSVTEDTKWGTVIEINHGNGITARYCGVTSVTVQTGDTVSANQKIAVLGEIPCEAVEAVHLHWETAQKNTFVDPMHIIGLDG